MPLIDKATLCVIAVDSMNDIHYEEADLLNALDVMLDDLADQRIAVTTLDEKLDEFLTHMTAHFRGEELQMIAINFPPYPVHKQEHDIVLQRAVEVLNHWKSVRDTNALAQYLRVDLPQWLDQHIATMDKVTAHFLAQAGKQVELAYS
jgi:hemerythrin